MARVMNAASGTSEAIEPEQVQVTVHAPEARPTLVYLPGTHGDWTLIGSFCRALAGRVRFVVVTYPRTLTWSLEDYAAAVEGALAAHGLDRGWLLGESFGSQVVWPLAARARFGIEGVILAGGFGRYPSLPMVRTAERLCAAAPLALVRWILAGYARVARLRYRRSPEVRNSVNEFIARRTELDRRACVHRLHLIAQNDPRSVVQALQVPVFALSGLIDPVVPWPWARRWLRRNCPMLRQYRLIGRADHTVLSTAPDTAAEQVLAWIGSGQGRGDTSLQVRRSI